MTSSTGALAPNPGDPDRGIFSGNAFVSKDGTAVMLYHGCKVGNCIATSTEDDLTNWAKLPANPIVAIPTEGDPDFGKYRSWDPHGWLEEDTYYAVFGGNPATLSRAKEPSQWTFVGRLLAHDMPGVDPDEDISCPDLFKLGDRHVLLCISHKKGCRYYIGRFEDERFHPEFHGRMNWPGGTRFAPESLLEPGGRCIMWAWALDRRPEEEAVKRGWSGTMALPRVLSLGPDGDLLIDPPQELSALRTNHRKHGDIAMDVGETFCPEDVNGDCMELELTVPHESASHVALSVRRSPGGEEQTVISYGRDTGQLRIELGQSSLNPQIRHHVFCMHQENHEITAQEAPLVLRPQEPLCLRVFLDRSILEVFANGRQCMTQRIYPTRSDSLGIALSAKGSRVAGVSLESWKMKPTNAW